MSANNIYLPNIVKSFPKNKFSNVISLLWRFLSHIDRVHSCNYCPDIELSLMFITLPFYNKVSHKGHLIKATLLAL